MLPVPALVRRYRLATVIGSEIEFRYRSLTFHMDGAFSSGESKAMRVSAPQSHLIHPLTGLLGQGGNVRMLRALVLYGGPLSIGQLARETGLSPPGVRAVLMSLVDQQVVVQLGAGRALLFQLRERHPLADALKHLFASERARWEAVLAAVRAALHSEPAVEAAWYYGSVARGEDGPRSDLDVAVAVANEDVEAISRSLREVLEPTEDALLFTVSLTGLSPSDIRRLSAGKGDPFWRELVRDARILIGDRPETLAARHRRRAKAA
jgi:predicted nucleotidyltransferase